MDPSHFSDIMLATAQDNSTVLMTMCACALTHFQALPYTPGTSAPIAVSSNSMRQASAGGPVP
eukprot:3681547-Amphidinium_carterae.1